MLIIIDINAKRAENQKKKKIRNESRIFANIVESLLRELNHFIVIRACGRQIEFQNSGCT